MDCREVGDKLAEYQLGGLEESARAAVEAHLPGCAQCRAELAALARLDGLLAPMESVRAPEELWAGIEARLQPRHAGWWQWAADWRHQALAAAAILIAAVGLALGLHSPAPTAPTETLAPAYQEQQIVAEWASPLADDAALGVAFASLQGVESGQ